MSPHVIVYGSWFAFAIIAYLIVINLFGFIWAFRIQSKNRSIATPLIAINTIFGILSLAINILIIVLYSLYGKSYVATPATIETKIKTFYTIVFFFAVFLMLGWMAFVIMFSNNFLIVFTDEKIYLFGLSIINSAIIKIEKQNNWFYNLEYVYKKDGNLTYTEKCRFWIPSLTTKFLLKNHVKFMDLKRNNAFFKLDQVLKTEKKPLNLTKKTSSQNVSKPKTTKKAK